MAEVLGKTTRLMAVNTMLDSIGEAPVADLTPTGRGDVVSAIARLEEVNREIQEEGWWFNTETITITIDVGGELPLPANTLSVDRIDYWPVNELVERDDKLYNVKTNSFTDFPAHILADGVEVDVITLFGFESIPQVARHYIMINAARRLADRRVGDPTTSSFTKNDELTARVKLEQKETENGDYNIFKNYKTGRVLYPWHR